MKTTKMRIRFHLIAILAFISLSAMAHSVVEWDGFYEVKHSWKCNGRECSITLRVNTDLYDYYRNDREHLAYKYTINEDETEPNYYSFMLSEHDRPVMRAVANEFSRYATSEKEAIMIALTFVQSLPYAYDSDSKGEDEYVRYPVETLVDGCGDCEDKVALLAAMLHEMEIDFVLLVLPDHIAIGVHCDDVEFPRYLLFQGNRYYYLETTLPNWSIGDIPREYYSAEMEVVPMDETPGLLIKAVRFESQEALVFDKADCELQLDLHNLGPGKVTEMGVLVRLVEKGKRDRLLLEKYFPINDMQEGEFRTELLDFKSHIKENTLLQVEVTGWEVGPQYYELELDYRRMRRF